VRRFLLLNQHSWGHLLNSSVQNKMEFATNICASIGMLRDTKAQSDPCQKPKLRHVN
jgi:hypothetical protein